MAATASGEKHHKHQKVHKQHLRTSSFDGSKSGSTDDEESAKIPLLSKYKRFQAMGFQIYTGGAPALIPNSNATLAGQPVSNTTDFIENPECVGLNSYGHFGKKCD